MSSTEAIGANDLAFRLFDEVMTPLSATPGGQERRKHFLKGFDTAADSYFERPRAIGSTGTAVAFPGGGAIDGLVDALASFWADRGETDLAAMRSRLLEIALALKEEGEEADGDVDIFCYTMF